MFIVTIGTIYGRLSTQRTRHYKKGFEGPAGALVLYNAGSAMSSHSSADFASDWSLYLLAVTLIALLLTYLWYR